MEWVTTSGKTIEEAQDRALDQLGIDASEAEFEILSEAKVGLFGRIKEEARIRARVRPTAPRDTDRRRGRERRPKPKSGEVGDNSVSREDADSSDGDVASAAAPVAQQRSRSGDRPRNDRNGRNSRSATDRSSERNSMSDDETRSAEEQVGREFLLGLLAAAGVAGSVEVRRDDNVSELAVSGDSLGFLIGPRGATLSAIQALTRAVAQRDHERGEHRLSVDIGEYAQRRKAALEAFARKTAQDVVDSGRPKMMDPMVASERKIVHDVLGDVPGIATSSVGEEPRRSVVVSPA